MPAEPTLPRVVALITHLHQPRGRSRVARLFEQVSADYQGRARIEIIETTLARLLPQAQALERQQQADIILCSGASAQFLRQRLKMDVVAMHMGEQDLIRALDQASAQTRQVGVLSFGQRHLERAATQSQFSLAVRERTYTNLEHAREQVGRLVEEGYRVIIGSSTIAQLADAAGAQGLLALDTDSVRRSLDHALSVCQRRKPGHPHRFTARYRFEQILGEAPAMRATVRLAQRYATTDATVLITGESGTGKELLAQSLHNASPRQAAPFVAINCAAFPESLLESELFGYEDGAFTGSRKGGKPGLIELAHTGTLFLDEIGDMPLPLQTRLLRVLQEREVLRLGACEPTPVDIRIVAATHCDLRTRMAEKQFREDLYYRLNILHLAVPPLRERVQDILPLFSAMTAHHGLPALSAEQVQPLLPHLLRHRWPGNVRELQNIAERAAIALPVLEGEDSGGLARLFPEFFEQGQTEQTLAPPDNLRSLGKAAEAAHARQVVETCQGDLDEAARCLGVSRSTLWRRLRTGKMEYAGRPHTA